MLSMGHFGPPTLSDENSPLILREMTSIYSDDEMRCSFITDVRLRDGHDFPLSDEPSSLRVSDDEESSLRLGAPNNTRGITIAQSKGPP